MKKAYMKILLACALSAGDLGGKSTQRLVTACENDDVPTEDNLSNVIFDAVTKAEDPEEVLKNFDYYISQLTQAKAAVVKMRKA